VDNEAMHRQLDYMHRAKATAVHLIISVLMGLIAAALVFLIWYPGPYRVMAGGQQLFWLLMAVDIALGPLLTFAIFNPRKGWWQLRCDLALIGTLQLAALAYGLATAYAARPVAMVFEVDRFRVVTATQVSVQELPKARAEYQKLPLTGPRLLGTRIPKDSAENDEALATALQTGLDRAHRPQFWQPYADSVPEVQRRARPLAELLARYPELRPQLTKVSQDARFNLGHALFLPVVARNGDWVVLLDANARPVHYAAADGFF
jgi:hypothetical protein